MNKQIQFGVMAVIFVGMFLYLVYSLGGMVGALIGCLIGGAMAKWGVYTLIYSRDEGSL